MFLYQAVNVSKPAVELETEPDIRGKKKRCGFWCFQLGFVQLSIIFIVHRLSRLLLVLFCSVLCVCEQIDALHTAAR